MTLLSTKFGQSGRVQVGSVISQSTSATPAGYLACDGSAVSRTTYASLFSKISTTFGVGDGSTTFNVPNTSGLFPRSSGSQTVSAKNFNGGSLATKARDKTGANGLTIGTTSTPSLSLSNTDLSHTHTYSDYTTTSFTPTLKVLYESGPSEVNVYLDGTNTSTGKITGNPSVSMNHAHTITPSISAISTVLASSGTESKPASLSVNYFIKY